MTATMRASSERVRYVKERIARGEYRVSTQQIAGAMLQHMGAAALERQLRPGRFENRGDRSLVPAGRDPQAV
jgi:hypothetical protein